MNPLAEGLSSALLHFLWQGLAVASILWTALWLMRGCSANARYVASCAALAMQAALPVVTTLLLYTNPPFAYRPVEAHGLPIGIVFMRPNTSIDWQSWALPLWFAGVLIFSMRLGWGYLQVAALRRRGIAADAALRAMVSELAKRMKLSRSVQVLTASLPDGPSVIGWIRPVILIPAATIAGLTPEQLEMVLAHELAHIRRFDYLVNLGQMLIETLLFYHPAVWWVSARIRQERELCCDDIAVRVCGNPISYARALTALEKLRSGAPSLAMGAASKPLLYRIQRLTGTGTADYPARWAGILAICATLVCFALNVKSARGQAQVPPSQSAPTSVVPAAPQAPAARKPRVTKKKLQAPAPAPREENPWIRQIIVYKPEPPKPDPLPSELSSALKAAEWSAGWELGYRFSAHGDNGTDVFARSSAINRDLMRLEKEAAGADSADTREKIFAELRVLIDELNKTSERLREARHEEGEMRDPPADARHLLPGN